jgi:predicted acyltransferase
MLSGLFVAGVAMLVTGFCWDMIFPINKKYGQVLTQFIPQVLPSSLLPR